MVQKREAYAPWSLTRKAGVQSATVNGDIEVPQFIQPVLDTGFVDEKGDWKGVKSSDEQFIGFSLDEAIANGGDFLFPSGDAINMLGYKHVQIALRVATGTGSGACAIKAVVGTDAFLNLGTLKAAIDIRMVPFNNTTASFELAVNDAAETIYNEWRVFTVYDVLADVANIQFSVTNNIGGERTFHSAYRRLV
jgi:hypothetical protein